MFNYNNIASFDNILTYFYKFEFQGRGTVHVHLLVWLKDIKQIRLNLLQADIPWANDVIPVVYHLHRDSGNFGWKINGTLISGPPNRKITGINGLLKKVVLFDRLELFNSLVRSIYTFSALGTSSRLFVTYFLLSYLSATASA